MYIILNKLKPQPQFRDEYIRLLTEEIAEALQKEPGMVRFDILEDASDPGQFYVYEVWTDRAAFDFHHRQPYRNVFIDTTKDWYAVRPKSPGEIIAKNIWPPDSRYTPRTVRGCRPRSDIPDQNDSFERSPANATYRPHLRRD